MPSNTYSWVFKVNILLLCMGQSLVGKKKKPDKILPKGQFDYFLTWASSGKDDNFLFTECNLEWFSSLDYPFSALHYIAAYVLSSGKH